MIIFKKIKKGKKKTLGKYLGIYIWFSIYQYSYPLGPPCQLCGQLLLWCSPGSSPMFPRSFLRFKTRKLAMSGACCRVRPILFSSTLCWRLICSLTLQAYPCTVYTYYVRIFYWFIYILAYMYIRTYAFPLKLSFPLSHFLFTICKPSLAVVFALAGVWRGSVVVLHHFVCAPHLAAFDDNSTPWNRPLFNYGKPVMPIPDALKSSFRFRVFFFWFSWNDELHFEVLTRD